MLLDVGPSSRIVCWCTQGHFQSMQREECIMMDLRCIGNVMLNASYYIPFVFATDDGMNIERTVSVGFILCGELAKWLCGTWEFNCRSFSEDFSTRNCCFLL